VRRLKWPKPYILVLVVGVLVAAGTLVSGIAPRITEWTSTSHVTREPFVDVPDPVYWAFYLTVAVMLFLCAWLVAQRVRNYSRGKPDDRRTTKQNLHRRMRDFRAGVWMQTLLRDPAAGLMHSCIYFGFLWLFIATVVLEIDHQLPDNLKFLHGGVYEGYSFAADLAGVVFLVGIVWAIGRRYLERPYRIRIKTKPEDGVILGTFLLIGVTGFLTEAFRIALEGRPDFEKWSFIGYPISSLFDAMSTAALQNSHRTLWIIHFVAFLAFLVILPTTKLRHMITSPMNMYLRASDRPKGAMKPMPNLMETELDTFGASTIEDFTWKQLFDTDACTVALHVGVPRARDRQAARPARDRAEGRRGHDRDRQPGGVAARGHVARHHHRRRLRLRADHLRGAVELHVVQGV
jgi:nitrate reductase gamma subunit